MKRFLYCFTLVSGLLSVPHSLRAQSSDGSLQPNDVVHVTVWQREELSGEFVVAPDGSLNHPLYRELRVTGIPVSQVEERFRSFLSAYEANPQVLVQPFYKVAIAGAVMRPEIYDMPPGTTVSSAITRAGGVTETGKRDDVRLFRNGDETKLDLTEREAMQTLVQSGDQILVRSEGSGGLSGIRSTLLPLIQIGLTIANIVIYR